MLTVWIAIDEATTENGCLFFVDGSHREAVPPHVAPPLEYDPSVIIRVSEAYDRFMVFAVQTIGYLRLSVFPCTSR